MEQERSRMLREAQEEKAQMEEYLRRVRQEYARSRETLFGKDNIEQNLSIDDTVAKANDISRRIDQSELALKLASKKTEAINWTSEIDQKVGSLQLDRNHQDGPFYTQVRVSGAKLSTFDNGHRQDQISSRTTKPVDISAIDDELDEIDKLMQECGLDPNT